MPDLANSERELTREIALQGVPANGSVVAKGSER